MLTYLRKMRKKLINSGSTKKYLLYAFGEIFLVMIGILLALSVNNWNTQNQNNKRELEYINRLISDISVDEGLLTFTDSLVHAKEKAIQRLMVLYLSEEIINSDTLIYLLNESRKLSFTLPQERLKQPLKSFYQMEVLA